MPVGIVVLITGVGMVLIGDDFSFADAFVGIGFTMVVIGALLGKFVFEPGSNRAAEAIESGDKGAIRAAAGRLAAFGTVDTLLLVFAITAMVLRLGT
jgi:hypothetical protein